jgi:hypothetical protein
MNDLFFLIRPSPPLHHRIAVIEPPRNAAPGPPSSYPSPPRAPHRLRELPRLPCRCPWMLLCSTTITPHRLICATMEPLLRLALASLWLPMGTTTLPAHSPATPPQPTSRRPAGFCRQATGTDGGEASPALSPGPTSRVGWAVVSRAGRAPL